MPDILMRYPGGLAKALTLSYDDGVDTDITLMDILDKHGIRCTFNINSGLFSAEGTVFPPEKYHRRMTARQAVEAYSGRPHEVAVHAATHPFLDKIPLSMATWEVIADRRNLEELFGGTVRGMAYPYGAYSDEVVDALRCCGIAYSRTTKSTEGFSIPTDWLRLPATCHHNNPRLDELCDSFLEKKVQHGAILFYLWGHSYEFERDNNWEVIERFAEKMGGKEDIWYATNIEIYDYIQDYNRLQVSVDGSYVYNPTARELFFAYGKSKTVYSVKPGESIKI